MSVTRKCGAGMILQGGSSSRDWSRAIYCRGLPRAKMTKRARAVVVVAALFLIGQAPSAQRGPGGPMRIILLVDSSAAVSSMIPQFRAGLADFLDELPGDPQIAIVTTGGQLRLRV